MTFYQMHYQLVLLLKAGVCAPEALQAGSRLIPALCRASVSYSLWQADGNSLLLFPSEMPFIFAEKCFPTVNDYILKAAFKIRRGKKKKIFFVPFLLLGEIVSYVIMAGLVLLVTLSNSLRFFNRKHDSEKHRRKPFQLLRGVAAQKVPLCHCFCIFFLI